MLEKGTLKKGMCETIDVILLDFTRPLFLLSHVNRHVGSKEKKAGFAINGKGS